ncbi:MAG: hypothetical protein QOJ64_2725 [Acidobacteriota bacterium]|jgi:hypothetical protein|nr:hypothetical protein [Acidobacteriota bacterium]
MFRANTADSHNATGHCRPTTRLACLLLLALLTPIAAGAYTIVLRSGRRIEIPSEFTVTSRTLTYEASPGINITLLMATIDVPATERANNEATGSLFKRVGAEAGDSVRISARSARRELTQADIEAARLARAKSEQDYERRRLQLGLPSLEESRLKTARETQWLVEAAGRDEAEQRQSEAYWRSRARAIRTEIASLEGEISYVRRRISDLPDYSGLASFGYIGGVVPGGPAVTIFPEVTGHPGFMRGPYDTRVLGPGFLAFGGRTTQGVIQPNPNFPRRDFARGSDRRWPPLALTRGFGVAPVDYGYGAERSQLILRLHEMEAARAGLEARWRVLEEEARRSGAQPGWLRP